MDYQGAQGVGRFLKRCLSCLRRFGTRLVLGFGALRFGLLAIATGITIANLSAPAHAHGVDITYQETRAIALEARYDGGQPMSGAQVAVFSPADPQTPWLRGTADESGRFLFAPDPAQPGNWEVQVRQAGHGEILVIPVGGGAAAGAGEPASAATSSPETSSPETSSSAISPPVSRSGGGLNPIQRFVMAASVIWGCVGTALFFSRRPKAHNAHT
ncbi:carboxypeptidase-like regulatory domain-containing protein [Thermoleptolyngbya oregonensis]|uniref:carboxypeptidase-like regulatory domain-containing protein n=1 Tax=Thermoleptolyngbya oregonensis TaxID=2303529 RepID=UPI00292CF7EF|nr:carboxypeptidase-like regulatory domain-containing protein [Thermoleptolyngbya oregonensis]